MNNDKYYYCSKGLVKPTLGEPYGVDSFLIRQWNEYLSTLTPVVTTENIHEDLKKDWVLNSWKEENIDFTIKEPTGREVAVYVVNRGVHHLNRLYKDAGHEKGYDLGISLQENNKLFLKWVVDNKKIDYLKSKLATALPLSSPVDKSGIIICPFCKSKHTDIDCGGYCSAACMQEDEGVDIYTLPAPVDVVDKKLSANSISPAPQKQQSVDVEALADKAGAKIYPINRDGQPHAETNLQILNKRMQYIWGFKDGYAAALSTVSNDGWVEDEDSTQLEEKTVRNNEFNK